MIPTSPMAASRPRRPASSRSATNLCSRSRRWSTVRRGATSRRRSPEGNGISSMAAPIRRLMSAGWLPCCVSDTVGLLPGRWRHRARMAGRSLPAPRCSGRSPDATVPAPSPANWGTARTDRPGAAVRRGWRALLAALAMFLAHAAPAQVAGSISVESDDRYRGRSLNNNQPGATGGISYDHASGIYVDVAAVAQLIGDDAGVTRLQGDVGYAVRLDSALSLDVGVQRSQYTSHYSVGRAAHYTELFFGLTRHRGSSRVYYSPDYLRSVTTTLYAEAEAALISGEKWHLSEHAGRLFYLTLAPAYAGFRDQYDWRLSLGRDVHGFDLHAALSGGGPGADFYAGDRRARTALVVGVSHVF